MKLLCISFCSSVSFVSQHGVEISHEGRQVKKQDFTKFTHILASDEANLRNLERLQPGNSTAEVRLWGSYLDGQPIADPYYSGLSAFDSCYEQCIAFSNAFLDGVAATTSSNNDGM